MLCEKIWNTVKDKKSYLKKWKDIPFFDILLFDRCMYQLSVSSPRINMSVKCAFVEMLASLGIVQVPSFTRLIFLSI